MYACIIPTFHNNKMSKNIILIDKRIQNYETIIAAIDPALAVGIVFDYYNDTFDSLKTHIDAIGITSDNATNATAEISVGLVQHNYRSPMFGMVASADLAPVANVVIRDPDLMLWAEFRDFIMWCKTKRGAVYFDLMACALYSDNDWKYIIDTLTSQTGVTIRASTDDTGSATLGGDWFLESHTGVNLKHVYFTEAIEEYRGVLYLQPYNNRKYSTKGFAIGTIIAWGPDWGGGSAPSSVTAANSGVVAVYSTSRAFTALKTDGSVVAWGYSDYGGTGAPSSVTAANSGVVAIYSTNYAFAALKTDGRVVAWGNSDYGGTGAPSSVTAANSSVVAVYSTDFAFAALKIDGSVVAWGSSGSGGSAPSSVSAANSGVVAVYSTNSAFAALKNDGSIVAWGNSNFGGVAPSTVTNANSGVVAVYSDQYAFAALKTDGSVVAWGDTYYGSGTAPDSVTAANSGVVAVYSTYYAFAALKTDGSVVTGGNSSDDVSAPSSVTAANSGVVAVYSTENAFAALKPDGSVVAWGSSGNGGNAPSSVTTANSGVVAIYSTGGAFAALKTDGSVVAWGPDWGGGIAPSSVTAANSSVVAVYSTALAFAALKTDGRVVAWGNSDYGGNGAPSSVTAAGSDVVAVYSAYYAFAALKTTASTFDINMSYYTDMDRYNILRKKENRRRVNLTTLNDNVFTLSQTRDIQSFNSTIPTDKTFHIIVPAYTSSPLSITSSATIPNSYSLGSVIIACDENEPVSISGTMYRNYGSFVYTLNASGSYIKTTSATINGLPYSLYGGDGINSSGIALLDARQTSTITTFTVASSKIVGDEPFAITTPRPTSNRSGAITYSSTNTAVATIDASGDFITIVGGGDVSFIATQEGTIDYTPATKTSNTLSVTRLTSTFSAATFEVESSKTYGDASFNIITAPISNSDGAITYSSSNTAVATIGASGNFISLVAAGSVSFTATQAQTSQYTSSTNTSNTLTVALGTSNLSSSSTFEVASSKTYGDAPFAITTRPTSNSTGAITYSSSNTAVATIDASGNSISLVAAGEVSFIATQAQTSQYASATKTSNTLTVSKANPSLVFINPPTSKNATDLASVLQPGFNEEFTLTATSASSGAVTYTSNNTAIATIGLTTGLVTLMGAGGTLIITASQASTAQYNAINATCSIVINYIDTSLIGQIVSPGTSYADVDFSGAILTGATLSGVSFSGASLINADLSGVVITGTNFTNTNINGAINLPAFSTVQKLQLLGNLNNIAIGAIQINTQVSGADINAMLPLSVSDIASATFTLKMPSALDASSNRNVTITSADISNNTSVYIPLNANQTVNINGTAFFFNGTNILDVNNKVRSFLLVEGVPFKLYAGSIIALNITESLNEVKVMNDGLYNIFSALLKPRST